MDSRIKQIRLSCGLTLEKFGERIGVTRAAVSKWENGDRSIADSMVVSICREFNVNERWLRTGEGEMFEQTRASVLDRLSTEYDLSREQRSVIEAFLDLDPQERDVILKYVHKVYDKTHPAPAPRRVNVPDDVAAAVVNVQDEVARYNAEQADEAASGGKEFSSTG